MRQNSDAGSTVVIGFVILLMLIALGIGIWALISLPAEIKEAESTHAIKLSNAFLDLKLSADRVRVNNLSGARFSMLMPGSSGMSGTTIGFEKNVGKLYMVWSGGEGQIPQPPLEGKEVERIFAQIGGSRGTTVIGYEGGGVFRSDNGKAVWLTPGLLEIYPDTTEKERTTVRVDMVVVNLTGTPGVSGNWGVPVDCVFVERNDIQPNAENRTMTISFTGGNEEQTDLWYAQFMETQLRYYKNYPNCTIDVEAKNEGEYATLTITAGSDEWVKVYIREATYDVSLVKRYEV
ncbi:hypothetical protein [Methanorbis furvi]|uniref:Uncharacterized protein n=1 Tax=Methanorbis furvi TaxID=3028299 RepID=A0AAE4SB69_9EURY|nr:hypothetical protein [Methanocorpusculaceae archaeon Ag1]